jgi:hypothetical protein
MVVHQLLLLALADGDYDARERLGVMYVARTMCVPERHVERLEAGIGEDVLKLVDAGDSIGVAEHEHRAAKWSSSRLAIVAGAAVGAGALAGLLTLGVASVVGGALGVAAYGLTGAAATAKGLAVLGGGAIAAGGAGVAGGQALLTSLAASAGAARMGLAVSRLTGHVGDFELVPLGGASAHVVLGVSGFLSHESGYAEDWAALGDAWPCAERYALKWEAEKLLKLGGSMSEVAGKLGLLAVVSGVGSRAVSTAVPMLAVPGAALAATGLVDNTWDLALDRAIKTGQILAACLLERTFGPRPVTLVGFSLGTRVIAEALRVLVDRGARGLLAGVYLLGGAFPSDDSILSRMHEVVDGPVVNGFAENDGILRYAYRVRHWTRPIGLAPLGLAGVRDVDLSRIVTGHLDYRSKLALVLHRVKGEMSPHSA